MVNKMHIKMKGGESKKVNLCQIDFEIKNKRISTREVEIRIK